MTRRRWIADTWDATSATLTGSQAAHLARVLRAQPGMQFDVVTGITVWRSAILTVDDQLVTFQLLEQIDASLPLDLTIVLSVFKFDRFEWAVEKLVELGAAVIEPAIVRRTEKHLAQAAANRVERWRRLALEAARQSRRSAIPQVADPRPLRDVLAAHSAPGDLRLLLAETEKQQTLLRALQSSSQEAPRVVLAIGPEGGWTSEEETLFLEQGWTAVSMGSTILRAETAAIAATAVATAWLNG